MYSAVHVISKILCIPAHMKKQMWFCMQMIMHDLGCTKCLSGQ
jgi:hypothetical protein